MSQLIADFSQAETEALLLDLLDMPISFHRCFVALTGKVTAALLLSYLWWSGEEVENGHDGWVHKALDEIREETGLSKDELATARRILRELAILDERRHGMPPALAFRVNHDRVAHLLAEHVCAEQRHNAASGALDLVGRQRT